MEKEYWKQVFYSTLERKGGRYFIQSLLDAGLDINSWKQEGKTVLSYAAELGKLEIVEFLVQIGADGNVTNSNGSKPLHIAVQCGHKDIVEFFLKLDIFIDSHDCHNSTPLHYIAKQTNFSESSKERYVELAHFLIVNGANLNAVDHNGCTPLHNASKQGCLDVVKCLVNMGCDVNAKTSMGDTPIILAAIGSHENVVKVLIECGANVHQSNRGMTLLHHASAAGLLDVVKCLVNMGCDINAKTCMGETPPILAAIGSHENVVKLLIEFGADVNQSNRSMRLVHYASSNGLLGVVTYLINQGCDINAETDWRMTPLLFAARYSHVNVVELLIESGAHTECCDIEGNTALHRACFKGYLELVKSLIKKGSNIHAQNYQGDTPLHVAVLNRRFHIIEHLFTAGVDCNITNMRDITAFYWLLDRDSPIDIVKLFLENGAYLQSNKYGVTCEKILLQRGILQDVKLCAKAVINRFNNSDLPKIYKIPGAAKDLPHIDKLKVVNNRNVARDIAQLVNHDIQTKGYCTISNICPISLNILCVRSIVGCC